MSERSRGGRSGHLTHRLVQFGRLLRESGLSVSTRQVSDLADALTEVGMSSQEDFYHVTRCFLLHGPEDRDLFDRLFELFWLRRMQWYMGFGRGQESSGVSDAGEGKARGRQPKSRSGKRLGTEGDAGSGESQSADELTLMPTYSPVEILRQKNFADYTPEDLATASLILRGLHWRLDERATRRHVRTRRRAPYPDLRRSIQRSMRHGAELVNLAWRRRKRRPRPLVVICDISGSMERYSQVFLQLMYGLVQQSANIEAFVFGTRLTRVTPALRRSDVALALRETSELVMDWSGGTRIGQSLKTFNYGWGRRVLGHGAVVLIISDGWDRGDMMLLEREIRRLRRCVSRLIWLNPLLGHSGYRPLVRGIQTVLPHVDDFLPIHDLRSLEQLAGKLGPLQAFPPRSAARGRRSVASAVARASVGAEGVQAGPWHSTIRPGAGPGQGFVRGAGR